MKIFKDIKKMQNFRKSINNSFKIGFIPTMGCLHDGHLSLIKQSNQLCDYTFCSIFVNPKQFGSNEDFDKYPRTFENDIDLLKQYQCCALFIPDESSMFKEISTSVSNYKLNLTLEGQRRPDFFDGISLVCTKLFNIIKPDEVFFGQKDIGQCILIQKLINDLNFDININICITERASDGLALSSRNKYLNINQRKIAPILFNSLKKLEANIRKNKYNRINEIKLDFYDIINHPDIDVEYISIADPENMMELSNLGHSKKIILSSAIKLGNVRLIDNLIIDIF